MAVPASDPAPGPPVGSSGAAGSRGAADLDVLIGEIKREAARRRAEPDFPVGEEAALAIEMDRQGPTRGAVDLGAVLVGLDRLAHRPDGGLAELAGLVASGVRAAAGRLSDLERRLDRLAPHLESRSPATSPEAGAERHGAQPLDHWDPVIADLARSLPGPDRRVLIAGPGAGRLTGVLTGSGVDAYGVDPTLGTFDDEGPVRSGGVAAHLQTLGEGSLALTVLTGSLAGAELPHLDRWAAALAVRSVVVAVISEAPWAWRLRLGEMASDTASWRPASPETWMAVLDLAGYQLAGRYGPGGRAYCLVGRMGAPPAGEGRPETPGG